MTRRATPFLFGKDGVEPRPSVFEIPFRVGLLRSLNDQYQGDSSLVCRRCHSGNVEIALAHSFRIRTLKRDRNIPILKGGRARHTAVGQPAMIRVDLFYHA